MARPSCLPNNAIQPESARDRWHPITSRRVTVLRRRMMYIRLALAILFASAVTGHRLDRSEPFTCDLDHRYTAEQAAFDHGLMDRFIQFTGARYDRCDPTQVMDYYDGNTVTALWNYAQHGAMSDNFFGSTFGPSTPGALNLISGQTHGAVPANLRAPVASGTVIGDVDPAFDDCSTGPTIQMQGRNAGDLLNARGVTWGWFAAGFRPTATVNGVARCGSIHQNARGVSIRDYFPDTEPFQYDASTANPHQLPPSAAERIGVGTDRACRSWFSRPGRG